MGSSLPAQRELFVYVSAVDHIKVFGYRIQSIVKLLGESSGKPTARQPPFVYSVDYNANYRPVAGRDISLRYSSKIYSIDTRAQLMTPPLYLCTTILLGYS